MQEFDTTMGQTEPKGPDNNDREALKEQAWGYLTYFFKRLVVLVSFGPGILGVVWLLGRIFKR